MSGVLNSGYAYREQVDASGDGRTVLQYLAERYPRNTASEWQARIERGEVSVAGQTAAAGESLRRGKWLVWNRPPWVEPEAPGTYDVLYEDGDLLAVCKPRGLPTVPGGGFLQGTLLTLVRQHSPDAAPMHRLGRGTSGVVLFARTAAARSALQAAWRRREPRKIYRAKISGRPADDAFTVTTRIGPVSHPLLGEIFAASPDGRAAVSHVRILQQKADSALAEVTIETGRPHQIRIHLAAAGHPLSGDPLYAAGGTVAANAVPGDCGYWLHAHQLVLRHPASGVEISIEAPLPSELELDTPR